MKPLQLVSILFFLLFGFSASAQDYTIENNEVKIRKEIKFKTGTAELLPESDAALLIIKKYLEDKAYISLLRVEAHTDNTGEAVTSQLLSQKRAAAVCQKLIALGVDCMRLLPVGFGDTKPVADNSTPEGKAQNDRISFVNAALRGKAIGGMPVDGGGKTVENPCY
ncbi:MAG: OmpA family protein [Chitinophagaceae bacterium]|nr:OmpA family protein [Chitinophagaceae bacterium]